jgi:hypothetical protein
MLALTGIERPPIAADRHPPAEPFAAVKFSGKVGDFVEFEVTAFLNQGLTEDVLVRDAQMLIRDAVATLGQQLQERWPELRPADGAA